jgi:hypothetical protein
MRKPRCDSLTLVERLNASPGKPLAVFNEFGWLEDRLDVAAILKLAEPLLAEARQLAEWATDGPLDETGAEMLVRIAKRWLRIESILDADGILSGRWCVDDARFDVVAGCLHDLACSVRKNADWFKYLPEFDGDDVLCLAPNACMGMPPAAFAKRLTVAVELLKAIVPAAKSHRQRMTVQQANEEAMRLARKMRMGFFALSERQQAKLIGCSWVTWKKTLFYVKAKKMRPAGKVKRAPSPKTRSITAGREAVLGEGKKDHVLQELIADQDSDGEPSPLERDPPDRPRKIHFRNRL